MLQVPGKSSDGNHKQTYMTPRACKICAGEFVLIRTAIIHENRSVVVWQRIAEAIRIADS